MADGKASGPANLTELQRVAGPRPPWLVSLVQPEIGGGKISPHKFAGLDAAQGASALRVGGLDQATFEQFVSEYGGLFTAIHFWKCPRVQDLSPLEDLPRLELVAYYWNQRATTLWDFRKTPRLRGLCFHDFTKISALDFLSSATSLEELAFGDVVDRRSVFESLAPLAGLTGLRQLEFIPRKIVDGRVEPIGALVNLERLNCPTNLFTSRQYAWLRARLPRAGESRVLQPFIKINQPIGGKDVLLVGRGKSLVNSATSEDRIKKHTEQFEVDIAEFLANPDLLPD